MTLLDWLDQKEREPGLSSIVALQTAHMRRPYLCLYVGYCIAFGLLGWCWPFAWLLSLPFYVVSAGLLRDWCREREQARRHHPVCPHPVVQPDGMHLWRCQRCQATWSD